MARWRPLHQNITRSDKMLALAREGDYFAMNLYQNMLPYTDRAGRLNAHPLALLGSIFEGYPWTPEQIHAGLEALNRVGLITWYRTARQGYLIEYTNFEGLNILDGREAKSQLPGPTDDDCTIIPPARTGPEQVAVESPDNPMEITWDASESPGNLSAAPGNPHEPVRSFSALHVQSTSTSTPTLTTLVENASEPPPPELVEAAPRRELTRAGKSIQKGKARDPNAVRAIDQPFVDAWNENRGPLPSVLSLDQGRRRHLDKLRAELGDEALDVFTDATKQLAREPFYRQKGYGLTQLLAAGNLLTWAEKWRSTGGLTDADRRLADKAKAVADAIGGLS
ncbi:MAG: hypothetical protein KF875_03860 [Trueperaceae bacterium]|nr:hypothetical protein [Trueperaceae bacterium]